MRVKWILVMLFSVASLTLVMLSVGDSVIASGKFPEMSWYGDEYADSVDQSTKSAGDARVESVSPGQNPGLCRLNAERVHHSGHKPARMAGHVVGWCPFELMWMRHEAQLYEFDENGGAKPFGTGGLYSGGPTFTGRATGWEPCRPVPYGARVNGYGFIDLMSGERFYAHHEVWSDRAVVDPCG